MVAGRMGRSNKRCELCGSETVPSGALASAITDTALLRRRPTMALPFSAAAAADAPISTPATDGDGGETAAPARAHPFGEEAPPPPTMLDGAGGSSGGGLWL